jgi:nitrite reductase/ring-hydroxylating ferredoxin subunit
VTGDCSRDLPGDFQRVLAAAELPEGAMRCVELDGASILLCHTREGYFAIDDVCSHAFARLHEGRLRGCSVICPLHGASFDVRDGRVLGPPARRALRSYPLRIRDEHIEILSGSARSATAPST